MARRRKHLGDPVPDDAVSTTADRAARRRRLAIALSSSVEALDAGAGHEPAVDEAQHPVGGARPASGLWVTRTHRRLRPPGPAGAELAEDDARVVLVQVAGRLVGQEHGGLVEHRAAEGHPLLLASRTGVGG